MPTLEEINDIFLLICTVIVRKLNAFPYVCVYNVCVCLITLSFFVQRIVSIVVIKLVGASCKIQM